MKKTLIQNAFQSSLVLLVTSLAMMSCQKETTEIAKIIDAKITWRVTPRCGIAYARYPWTP